MIYLSPLTALVVTALALSYALKRNLLSSISDLPNERSLHTRATPRIGGLMLMLGVVAGGLVARAMLGWYVWTPMLGLVALSFVDDRQNLPARYRFLGHLLAASLLVIFGIPGTPAWLCVIFVIAVVWSINLYNFMDGADGLAGGMAVFGFGSLAWASAAHGDLALATFALCLAGAALGFLLFNFHPAKVFMGDAGSVPLGFCAAALGLLGYHRGLWSLLTPMVAFSPFAIDATVTLLKRTLRGEKPWQAHREHYYQRLVQLGAGHRNTALAEYAVMLAAGVSSIAIIGQSWPTQLGAAATWLVIYVALGLFIDARWRRFVMQTRRQA